MKTLQKIFLVVLAVGVLGVFLSRKKINYFLFSPTKTNLEQGATNINKPDTENQETIKVIAKNLTIPWDFVFLPNNDLLVTERPGNLLRISQTGEKTIISKINGVQHIGEGGLLGIALHPDFENNRWIYLYLTSKNEKGLQNRVERYEFEGNTLKNRKVILENIKGAQYHDGGKIAFGPDGFLYITTGDAGNKDLAQDTNSLNGKILRITDEGKIPDDNPFSNEVYSYGHRNPQGIVWDEKGTLWSTEHGPSGLNSGFDELNIINMGNNYGWPTIIGNETRQDMISPVIQSGANDTWAPGAIAYLNGSLFFGGLRGESLYEADIEGGIIEDLKVHFRQEFGRIRAVKVGPDGFLYISTSNQDGRGKPKFEDDKIIRIDPVIFR